MKRDVNSYREVLNGGSTVEDMAQKAVKKLGVVNDENLINKTKLTKEKNNEFNTKDYGNYNKYYIVKGATYKFKSNAPKFTSSYIKSKETWDEYRLEANKEYVITYSFYYFEDIQKMLYTCNISPFEKKDGETDTDALKRIENDQQQTLDNFENESNNEIKLTISMSMGATGKSRDTYTEFHDVLTDTDYYTQINDINSSDARRVENATSKVLSIITNIAMVVSVIILAVIGVKYMIGSAEERAEYKKDMIPYLVGAVLIFGISIIVKILYNFGNQIKAI